MSEISVDIYFFAYRIIKAIPSQTFQPILRILGIEIPLEYGIPGFQFPEIFVPFLFVE